MNGITPATSTVLVDMNDAAQLAKFGLNNGPQDNANTLSEKWEALALVPALDPRHFSATPAEADEKFAARAPEAVVAKERAQLMELEAKLVKGVAALVDLRSRQEKA